MSEKLCLKWSDFRKSAVTTFWDLKEDTEFSDVTLVSEDGQHVESHKVILAASSPFFKNMLRGNRHLHPLVFMKGTSLKDLKSLLEFIYCGETKICQNNLDAFLAIAEELKIKGLARNTTFNHIVEEEGAVEQRHSAPEDTEDQILEKDISVKNENFDINVRVNKYFNANELDEKIESLMNKSQNMMRNGESRRRAFTCTVCGKEDKSSNIKDHIETNHLEGVCLSCNLCEKTFKSRKNLRHHTAAHHKDNLDAKA